MTNNLGKDVREIKKITIPLEYLPGVIKTRSFDERRIQVKTYLIGEIVKKIMLDIFIETNPSSNPGKLGGLATSKKYGKEHFRKLAKKRWSKL